MSAPQEPELQPYEPEKLIADLHREIAVLTEECRNRGAWAEQYMRERDALAEKGDSRREAILYEIAAVASRYEQDTPPADDYDRAADICAMWNVAPPKRKPTRSVVLETAGRCVAWLENLDTQAKP